jgi:hypothetical protein
MSNSLSTVVAATMAGVLGAAVAAPGLAKGHKHAGYAAPFPVGVVRPITGPQFIRVGPMAIGLRQRGAAGSMTVATDLAARAENGTIAQSW